MKKMITLLFVCLISGFSMFVAATTTDPETGTVTDYDGNVYATVKIGDQWWMSENLRTTHFYDGTAISQFSGSVPSQANDYQVYYTYPNNDENNVDTYGLLYSWSVIANQDASVLKSLLPSGWHVASISDWETLSVYLGGTLENGGFATIGGGYSSVGTKLKSTSLWTSSSVVATDESGFDAVPAGDMNTSGYTSFGNEARFWTPQLVDANQAGRKYIVLSYNSESITRNQFRNVNALSLRLVKDVTTATNDIGAAASVSVVNSVVSDVLTIKGLTSNSQLRLYAVSGALLKTGTTGTESKFDWNLNDLKAGIYLLCVDDVLKIKIVKK